jgi:hypothetical protein
MLNWFIRNIRAMQKRRDRGVAPAHLAYCASSLHQFQYELVQRRKQEHSCLPR